MREYRRKYSPLIYGQSIRKTFWSLGILLVLRYRMSHAAAIHLPDNKSCLVNRNDNVKVLPEHVALHYFRKDFTTEILDVATDDINNTTIQ